MEKAMDKIRKNIVNVLFIIILTVFGTYLFLDFLQQKNNSWDFLEDDSHQAVFLDNNQVYFGRLSNVDDQFFVLTNIYYLQSEIEGHQIASSQLLYGQEPGTINIVKLGNELHGPSDKMWINRDQIIFIENLKEGSNIVKVIRETR